MSTHLSRFFKQRRLALGLRMGQVAERTSRRKSKMANRIIRFEEIGEMDPRLFVELQAALGITDAEVDQMIELDRREHFEAWLEWVNEPVEPHLTIRAIPGVFAEHSLPEGLETLEQMEEYARQFSKRHHKMVWLCPGTNRFTVRFDEEGNKICVVEATPDCSPTPWMRLAKSRKPFLFHLGRDGRLSIKNVALPKPPVTTRPQTEIEEL